MGRVFQYGTALSPEGANLKRRGPTECEVEQTKKLNKLPEFRRAAKKRERRDDWKTQDV